jgi:ParB/RepB/Spo0J family partition protein
MQYDPNRVYDLPVNEILSDSSFNVRGIIDPTDVIELARDIKERGLDSPIIVQPWEKKAGKKWRVVAGHRRYAAVKLNKSEHIRCLIRENLSDAEAMVINMTENVQRKQLNILQEAKGLARFRDYGWSEEQTAFRLGVSRGWVQVRFMLLRLPELIQLEAAAGILTNAQIRRLYAMTDEDGQFAYVRKIKDARLMGKKGEVKPEINEGPDEAKHRSEEEIFDMQAIIRENFGNSLATQLLGWAGGAVSNREIHQAIQQKAQQGGIWYPIPPEYV